MGKRGPKAKTAAENELAGNQGKRAKNKPKAESGTAVRSLPRAPHHLSRIAGCEWRRMGKELVTSNKLTAETLKALEMYCANYGKLRELDAFIQKNGWSYKAQSGYPVKWPEVSEHKAAQDAMLKWLRVLRDTTPAAKTEVDPFEEFLKSGGKLGPKAVG